MRGPTAEPPKGEGVNRLIVIDTIRSQDNATFGLR